MDHNHCPEVMSHTKGSALICALFMMTLIAIAATAMSMRLQLDIYRTRQTVTSDKLYYAAQLVTFWSMSELSHRKNSFLHADKHGKVASFPKKFSTSYPTFKLSGTLIDLQSRLNINNLSRSSYYPMLIRLLDSPTIKLSDDDKITIINNIRQWMTPLKPGRDKTDIEHYYLSRKPPYLPAHQPLQSISELRLIKGIDADLQQQLAPKISALPEPTAINLNTAPKGILKILGHGLNNKQVNAIIKAREKKGITNLRDLNKLLQTLNMRTNQITLHSQYYLSIATVKSNDLTLVKYTVLKRTINKKGRVKINVISESLNAF